MDERLEKALAFSNYRTTIEAQRKAIKRRLETMLVLHYQNGMFIADMSAISFINILIAEGHTNAIIIDQKNTPIDINDLREFASLMLDAYCAATTEYSIEYKKLAKSRDVKKIMDW